METTVHERKSFKKVSPSIRTLSFCLERVPTFLGWKSSQMVTRPIMPFMTGRSVALAATIGGGNSAAVTSGTINAPCRANVCHDDRWFAFAPCRCAASFTVTSATSVKAVDCHSELSRLGA